MDGVRFPLLLLIFTHVSSVVCNPNRQLLYRQFLIIVCTKALRDTPEKFLTVPRCALNAVPPSPRHCPIFSRPATKMEVKGAGEALPMSSCNQSVHTLCHTVSKIGRSEYSHTTSRISVQIVTVCVVFFFVFKLCPYSCSSIDMIPTYRHSCTHRVYDGDHQVIR